MINISENLVIDKQWLSDKRNHLMGLGILLVVLFHAFSTFGKLFILFIYGFIGVDIFMLLSGFGLSQSFQIHSIKEFYIHRLRRILPLFLCFAFIKSILYQVFGTELTLYDYFLNLSTLSYYGIGGQFIDWYLCSTLLLYLCFPILYHMVRSCGLAACIFTLLGCIVLYNVYPDLHWSYKCLVSRVPIFCFGIYNYLIITPPHTIRSSELRIGKFKSIGKTHALVYGLVVFSFLVCVAVLSRQERFLIISMFSIFLLRMLSMYPLTNEKVLIILQVLGQYSLEIYISNCLIMFFIRNFIQMEIGNRYYYVIPYFLLHLILVPLFVLFSRGVRGLNK